jgi:hypothetical protein
MHTKRQRQALPAMKLKSLFFKELGYASQAFATASGMI